MFEAYAIIEIAVLKRFPCPALRRFGNTFSDPINVRFSADERVNVFVNPVLVYRVLYTHFSDHAFAAGLRNETSNVLCFAVNNERPSRHKRRIGEQF